MGKVLILYDSASGNTAKMASLIAEGAGSIPGIEVRLCKVEEASADDVLWCDGLALGSPTNMGLLSWKMKRFWDEAMAPHWMKVDGKIACAFSSSGGWGGGTELACQSLLTVLINVSVRRTHLAALGRIGAKGGAPWPNPRMLASSGSGSILSSVGNARNSPSANSVSVINSARLVSMPGGACCVNAG